MVLLPKSNSMHNLALQFNSKHKAGEKGNFKNKTGLEVLLEVV